jgi:hypothetical protein
LVKGFTRGSDDYAGLLIGASYTYSDAWASVLNSSDWKKVIDDLLVDDADDIINQKVNKAARLITSLSEVRSVK